MGRLFGTDGVRGRWGEDLTEELAARLGYGAVRVLGAGTVLVGRDTRASGEAIERALARGMAAAGGSASLAGVIPTAGVAALIGSYGAEAGAVISASHNPAGDNGIKFFGRDGMKLPDAVEDQIEAAMAGYDGTAAGDDGAGVQIADAEDRYLAFLLDHAPDLRGMRVVVDAANGAAYRVAPEMLRRAGASVHAIHVEPDGRNINDGCGSTHPETLQRLVAQRAAAVGLAHDGDADRLIAVDETGALVDGDQILAICALHRHRRGQLRNDAVVTTVMANLGFHRAMARERIEVVETAVGDRYVLEAMKERSIDIGGEQSGHIIFLDRHSTGDGLMTALRLLEVMAETGEPLSKLAAVAPRLPQVLLNVRVARREALDGAHALWEEVERVRAQLGDEGRVLLRPSGTEPVVRVMVQAPLEQTARAVADRLAETVQAALA